MKSSKFPSILILFLPLFSSFSISLAYPTYDQYLHDFNKHYSTEQETQFRKNIYDSRIQSFNTITDYTPGVNNMTDWTQQQINARRNPSILNNFVPTQPKTQTPSLKVESSLFPSSLDWRQKKAVTSIKNQDNCGACWAFSVVAYLESKLIIQRNYTAAVDLSEQYLVSCTPDSNCIGGSFADAAKIASNGLPYEKSFPYNPNGADPLICSTKNKVTEFGKAYNDQYKVTDFRMIELLQKGPVMTVVSGDGWENYGSGVYKCPKNAIVNHAVLIVGYTSTQWIAKNSWGSEFGQSGYIRISRSRNSVTDNCYVGYGILYFESTPLGADLSEVMLSNLFGLLSIVFLVLTF